jgi:hypothetical protein
MKYTSVNNILAKTFFDIVHSKNYLLLEPEGQETELDLEKAFTEIYDDFFVLSSNAKAKDFLNLREEVAKLEYKIESVKVVLRFLFENKTTKEMRTILLEALVSIGINVDMNNEFLSEIQHILQVELGIIENDINFAKMQLESLSSEKVDTDEEVEKYNFYRTIVSLENIFERQMDDEMLLIKFIEYQRVALDKVNSQKQKQAKF